MHCNLFAREVLLFWRLVQAQIKDRYRFVQENKDQIEYNCSQVIGPLFLSH